jgi:hypothetical protein
MAHEASSWGLFVEAVLFRYWASIPWRDLPERFGDWKIVYQRFNRWAKSGVRMGAPDCGERLRAVRLPSTVCAIGAPSGPGQAWLTPRPKWRRARGSAAGSKPAESMRCSSAKNLKEDRLDR